MSGQREKKKPQNVEKITNSLAKAGIWQIVTLKTQPPPPHTQKFREILGQALTFSLRHWLTRPESVLSRRPWPTPGCPVTHLERVGQRWKTSKMAS